MSEEKSSKKSWEDLVFSVIEKVASAPSKMKDSKESVIAAIDWMKSVKDDVQEKMAQELAQKLSEMDWENLSKKVGEHIVKNYDIHIDAKVSLTPKKKKTSSHDASS